MRTIISMLAALAVSFVVGTVGGWLVLAGQCTDLCNEVTCLRPDTAPPGIPCVKYSVQTATLYLVRSRNAIGGFRRPTQVPVDVYSCNDCNPECPNFPSKADGCSGCFKVGRQVQYICEPAPDSSPGN